MDKRWKSSNHAVYNCGYHIIWCPKYRKKVLIGKVEIKLKKLLLQKATEHGWVIEKMEVMPDHVHLFIKATANDAPCYIVAQLKGCTSHELRKEFSELRTKIPTLWTRSYYVETIGHISEKTIKKYIEEQKLR